MAHGASEEEEHAGEEDAEPVEEADVPTEQDSPGEEDPGEAEDAGLVAARAPQRVGEAEKASNQTLKASQDAEEGQRHLDDRRRPSAAIRCGPAAPTGASRRSPAGRRTARAPRCPRRGGAGRVARWNPPMPRAPRTARAMMTRPTKVMARTMPATMVTATKAMPDDGQRRADDEEEQLRPGPLGERLVPDGAGEPVDLVHPGFRDAITCSLPPSRSCSGTPWSSTSPAIMRHGGASRQPSRPRGRPRSRGPSAGSRPRATAGRAGARRPPPSWPGSASG